MESKGINLVKVSSNPGKVLQDILECYQVAGFRHSMWPLFSLLFKYSITTCKYYIKVQIKYHSKDFNILMLLLTTL